MLRSMRYGEADRILHLFTPERGRLSRDRQGRAAGQVALRRAAGAVLPPAARALPGPQRPAHGHERRDGRRPSAAARARRRARRRGARLRRGARGCSTTTTPTAASSTCSPTSSRCSTPTPRARHARATRSPSGSSCCSPPASRRSSPPARRAARRDHLVGFSGAAGGVVCSACEASAFPLCQDAHDFLVAALGRPLAEAPDAPPRALAQAERAIIETLEHHANVRLRPVASVPNAARIVRRLAGSGPARASEWGA